MINNRGKTQGCNSWSWCREPIGPTSGHLSKWSGEPQVCISDPLNMSYPSKESPVAVFHQAICSHAESPYLAGQLFHSFFSWISVESAWPSTNLPDLRGHVKPCPTLNLCLYLAPGGRPTLLTRNRASPLSGSSVVSLIWYSDRYKPSLFYTSAFIPPLPPTPSGGTTFLLFVGECNGFQRLHICPGINLLDSQHRV